MYCTQPIPVKGTTTMPNTDTHHLARTVMLVSSHVQPVRKKSQPLKTLKAELVSESESTKPSHLQKNHQLHHSHTCLPPEYLVGPSLKQPAPPEGESEYRRSGGAGSSGPSVFALGVLAEVVVDVSGRGWEGSCMDLPWWRWASEWWSAWEAPW